MKMRRFFQNEFSHFLLAKNARLVAFLRKIVNFYSENLKSSDFYNKMNEHVRMADR